MANTPENQPELSWEQRQNFEEELKVIMTDLTKGKTQARDVDFLRHPDSILGETPKWDPKAYKPHGDAEPEQQEHQEENAMSQETRMYMTMGFMSFWMPSNFFRYMWDKIRGKNEGTNER